MIVKQENIQAEMQGNKLVITVDISKGLVDKAPLSSSGKNRLIASTRGSLTVNNGPTHLHEVKVGLNVFAAK